jgi:peptide/nickel transport system substrate-binding protein
MAEVTDLYERLNQRLDRRKFLIGAAQVAATYSTVSFLIAACSTGGTTTATKKLRMGVAQVFTDPDPHTTSYLTDTQILENIYEGLTVRDPNTFAPAPALAESWTTSADGLTWTFKLRQGVKFHNGRTLVADDVKFSFDRILDPNTKASLASNFEPVKEVKVVDPQTVVLVLKRPYSILLESLLAPAWCAIVPKEAIATIKDKPVGTGPFQFVSQVPKTSVSLKKFADYWNKPKPYVDEVVYTAIPDESAKLAALTSNQVDFISTVPMAQVSSLSKTSGIKVIQFKSSWVDELGFNCKRAPFDDVRVRQAIAMAINKQEVAQAATFGLGGPMSTMVAPSSPIQVNVPGLAYDPQKAKALLAQAGHATGLSLTFPPCGGTAFPQMIRASEVIANNLTAIGIDAKATTIDGAVWGDNVVSKHEYSGFICGLVNGLDPDGHTYPYFSSHGSYNFSQYAPSSQLDNYLEMGRQVLGADQRSQLYTQAWQILANDVPWIPLYWVPGLVATRDTVSGFQPLPEFNLRLDNVKMG